MVIQTMILFLPGLQHSEVDDAIMAPYYRGYEPSFNLHPDDIKGIQQLYGNQGGRESPTRVSQRSAVSTMSQIPFLNM